MPYAHARQEQESEEPDGEAPLHTTGTLTAGLPTAWVKQKWGVEDAEGEHGVQDRVTSSLRVTSPSPVEPLTFVDEIEEDV